jgi:RNA polymerase sigma-70 factor, ECF subfamily
LSDATVVVSALDNPEAFGVLYDRYCDQIYRAAFRRLRDRQGAEDATAQTFFTALRSIRTYRPQAGPFAVWLHQIAVNTITEHLRAHTPRPADHLNPATDGQAINGVQADQIWRAVDHLPGEQRTAVTLRLGLDLPIADIAAAMDRTLPTIQLALYRGLKTLRTLLTNPATPAPKARRRPPREGPQRA